ncbi:flavin-containing monooxygenase [Deinococcus arcticus]|uniref:K+ transport protein n=1 Tax=Deinococcus arcticus TaxID=2136176 RepID=A0A2T3W4I3_9DEIO|nr:NAD(P)/FAD-dependent oxidoreductase [Deinococcus arcticus]PTA66779.1 K+ transport protein [Deinococcus arcticus]
MLDVAVIGGGQAGLAAGYFLGRSGLNFRIFDGGLRPGASWRDRYDSLVLFTPAKRSGLPGLPFPGDPAHYPTKDEVAAYLEAYAQTFELPTEYGAPVRRVRQGPDGFELTTPRGEWAARAVLVATGPFQTPFVPAWAQHVAPEVTQLHSSAYRRPSALPAGRVLVVGAGNSGAQIAEELTRTHSVTVAQGRPQPVLPQRVGGRDIFDVLGALRLLDVPVGSLLGWLLRRRDPVIGTDLRRLNRRGQLQLAPRVVNADGRRLVCVDGTRLEAETVVWATGFRPAYPWLDLEGVLDDRGWPLHHGGVTGIPGLSFLGLPWQRTRGSALLGGVGRDAQVLVEREMRRLKGQGPS